MHSVIAIAIRVVLILTSAVVLGLSVTLAKNQSIGSVPSETGFGSFVGAFGILVAAIGIVGLFVQAIPGIVLIVADALASVCLLAGGIALAVALKGVSCTAGDGENQLLRLLSKILNGGCSADLKLCGVYTDSDGTSDGVDKLLRSRCTQAQADFAFEFIACAAALGALAMTLLSRKAEGKAVFV